MSSGHWEWQDERGNWNAYDTSTQSILKKASGSTTIYAPNGHAYLVNLTQQYQENTRFQTRRPIRFVSSGSNSSFLSGLFGSSSGAAPAPPPGASIPQWACDKCTFINNGTDTNCGVCGLGVNPKAAELLMAQYGGASPSPPPPAPAPKRRKKYKAPVAPPAPPSGGGFFGMASSFSMWGGDDQEEEVESSGPRFVDPKELEKKKAKEEKKRIRKEKTDGERQARQLLVILKKKIREDECWNLLQELYGLAPDPTTEIPIQKEEFDMCQVCFADAPDAKMLNCGHQNCCNDCLIRHMQIKIKDDDIIPWICCPFPDCRAKIAPQHFKLLDAKQVAEFCRIQLSKALQRNSMWVNCKKESCHYGFLVEDKEKHKMKCEICGKKQTVCRAADQDDGIKEMLKNGTIRKCPKCAELTMKDKGLCNIINCGRCNIWWNWRTRETGNSQKEMKHAARQRGTLWEPGELRYQQQLERSNPAEFKALLERNGIKYDPSYRRGGW